MPNPSCHECLFVLTLQYYRQVSPFQKSFRLFSIFSKLILAALFLLVSFFPVNSQNAETRPELIVDVLIADEIKQLRQLLREEQKKEFFLNDLTSRVDALAENVSSTKLDTSSWTASKNTIDTILLKPDNGILTESEMRNTFKFFNAIMPIVYSGTTIVEKIPAVRRDYERRTYEYSVGYRLRDVMRNRWRRSISVFLSNNPDWGTLFDSDFDPKREIRRRNDGGKLKDIRDYLNAMKTIMEGGSEKAESLVRSVIGNVTREIISEYETLLGAELARVKLTIERLQAELSEKFKILEDLRKREAVQNIEIDQKLIYAIYAMIVVLALLFIILKILPEPVANLLIVRRSLVEVVGMAFMLVTIIILGTGDKLSKEILGTLLGTIAGYIFARSVSRDSRDNMYNQERADIEVSRNASRVEKE